MGRPAKFNEDLMLDAALRLVARGGPGAATVTGLAEALKAPVGSIYHRFASREELLARLWLRTVERFQRGFLAALARDELDAALHIVRWSRDHLDEARVLTLYRREDLATRRPEGSDLNAAVQAALRDHARRRHGRDDDATMQRLTFALIDIPYAAARRYLAGGRPPPTSIDDLVAATCRHILREI